MSVYRRDVIESGEDTVQWIMAGHASFALASLTAGQVRSKRQTVFPAPLPGEPSHAKVCGPKPDSVRRWFRHAGLLGDPASIHVTWRLPGQKRA